MVPAPRGMRAVGDGAVRSVLRRLVGAETGVSGEEGVEEDADVTGVMGFICRPLDPDEPEMVGGVVVMIRGAGFGDGCGMERTFSRWAWR